MAGLGEVCTHVASLMFAIEATVKLRDLKTVTQAPAYWLLLPTFTSAQMKKKYLDEAIVAGTQTTPSRVRQHKEVPSMSETELINFLHEINKGQVKPAIMRIVQHFNDNFIPKETQCMYPKLLSDLFDDEEIHQLPLCEVRKKCNELKIEVTTSHIEALEQSTRGQFISKLWQKHRTSRITASKFKAVCRTNFTQPAFHLIRSICYPDRRKFKSIQTSWGLTYEPKAKHQYIAVMKKNHTNFLVRSSGLFIHITHPEIGASPDGIISCDCCGIGSL
ncbi:hypothetical protein ACJMK2_007856 [Sinanodonta woodiana]|uniref:YqaJ viral recombinase domain-containing protein n=1 Tax=Sinanodonta woodiana TaxID=1069815 RepID=A0ABD3VJT4_SINWO